MSMKNTSLSARRAWIEITSSCFRIYAMSRRSPQGERGLKYFVYQASLLHLHVALRKESVD